MMKNFNESLPETAIAVLGLQKADKDEKGEREEKDENAANPAE